MKSNFVKGRKISCSSQRNSNFNSSGLEQFGCHFDSSIAVCHGSIK